MYVFVIVRTLFRNCFYLCCALQCALVKHILIKNKYFIQEGDILIKSLSTFEEFLIKHLSPNFKREIKGVRRVRNRTDFTAKYVVVLDV